MHIGGATAPTSDAEALLDALNLVRTSEFAKTAEGQKVLANIEECNKNGNITFRHYTGDAAGRRGQYDEAPNSIGVSDEFSRDPNAVASELVHEGTHGVAMSEHPRPENSIDEEVRTNTNQNNFYKEQQDEFNDRDLDQRSNSINGGTLRNNIRNRYPYAPEHASGH